MNPTPDAPTSREQELDLVDIWIVIRRHRLLMFVFLLAGLLGGIAWNVLRPAQYEHVLILEIGGVSTGSEGLAGAAASRFQLLEQPLSVVAKIEELHAQQAAEAMPSPEIARNLVEGLEVESTEGSPLVRMSLEAGEANANDALSLLNAIAERVLSEHNALLGERVDLLRSLAQKRLDELDARIEAMRASRAQVSAQGDAASKGLTLLMIDSQIQELAAEHSDIERELRVDLAVNVRPTRVVVGPVQSAEPAGPGPLLVVMLGLLAGLLLGVFAVAFVRLNAGARKRSEGAT